MTPELIQIQVDSIKLEGILNISNNVKGVVIFAHGSGSSRHSKRNKFVANVLNEANIGTLLFDLLTFQEDNDFENRFNIDLLSFRLIAVTEWVLKEHLKNNFKIGYFGASTGAAAAIQAASALGNKISVIVSRGGRPDLAKDFIEKVKAPILLIVGGNDDVVLELNKEVFNLIKQEKELKIIKGANHLFEEAGALEEVAELAKNWFEKYFLV